MQARRVKICGLTSAADLANAAQAGASYAGFVFFPKSPRNLSVAAARALAQAAPVGLAKVALVVDPDDAALDAILAQVPIDMLQLHGPSRPNVSPRCARAWPAGHEGGGHCGCRGPAETGAIRSSGRPDPGRCQARADAALPGGNGLAFDWRLIAGRDWARPWMLAGG